MSSRRLAASAVALLLCLVFAAPAAAQAPLIPPNSSVGAGSTSWGPLQWNEGTVQNGETASCFFGGLTPEPLGGAWLSWYGDLGVSPQVNQTFYVKVAWILTGFPCGTGSAYVAPEFALPRATSLAVTNDTPVRCFAKFDSSRPWQEFSRAECPQAPTGTGRTGGMSFNPTDASGAWPTASGVSFEIWVPVKASQPLTGDAPDGGAGEGCPNCLYGGVWFIDGIENPFLRPNVFIYTGPGGTPTGSATAPRVQTPVPNHYIGRDSQNPFVAAANQSRCVPATQTVSSWIAGEVYSQAQGGSAYFELGTGHPATPTYSVSKNNGSPTDVNAPAGDWRYDLCVLNFPAGNGQPLPPGDYHYRMCWDPGTYTAASTAGDVCSPDQRFSVPNPSETTAPDTEIVRKPAAETDGSEDTFTFKSSEQGSTFECSVDGGAFSPCLVLTLKNLAAGRHTLAARAKDPAGNRDPSPATHTWTVVRPAAPSNGGGGGAAEQPAPAATAPPVTPGPVRTGTGTGSVPAAGCAVPKLKKKTLAQAKKMLTKAGCKVGKVTKKKVGRRVQPGRVISSKPGAGRKLKRGAKVALVIGKR